jgi:hypothetical protein
MPPASAAMTKQRVVDTERRTHLAMQRAKSGDFKQ